MEAPWQCKQVMCTSAEVAAAHTLCEACSTVPSDRPCHADGGVKYLEVRVEEATGCNKDSQPTWDDDFVEGFVKGALVCLLPSG